MRTGVRTARDTAAQAVVRGLGVQAKRTVGATSKPAKEPCSPFTPSTRVARGVTCSVSWT